MKLKKKLQTIRDVKRTFGVFELVLLSMRKLWIIISGEEKIDLTIPSLTFDEFLISAALTGPNQDSLSLIRNEFDSFHVKKQIFNDKPRESFFSSEYDVSWNQEFLLWILVRKFRPSLVFETGVAAGASTRVILKAMELNCLGSLISTDVTSAVGELVEEEYKKRWTFKVLPKFRRRKAFKEIFNEATSCQIFIHDSNHSFAWQWFEIQTVMSRVTGCPIVVIDDISPRVLRMLMKKAKKFKVYAIKEETKFFGVMLPHESRGAVTSSRD